MAVLDSTCYVSTKDQLCTIDIVQHPKMQAEMQAYVRLFQERFAAINNDIVLNNTRVARGPITWQVCVTKKFITIIMLE